MSGTHSDIQAVLNRLYNPGLARIEMRLERIVALLALLDSPELRLPPVVHVAGTNGKGSTLAYLKAICEAAGYCVHRYTSPHLVRFNERIEIAGVPIADDYLLSLLTRVEHATKTIPATFFEATTVAAFLAFAENPADIVLLETGMGGRLDATNVIANPMLTCITPIAIDHAEFLGDTLAKIAYEKAGIMKPDVPCVVGLQVAEAMQVLEHVATEKNVPLFRAGKEWKINNALQPALLGPHQQMNAATAAACAKYLSGITLSAQAIETGIAQATWPGRLQQLTGKLRDLLPIGSSLWLDGGHNPAAGEALALWAAEHSAPLHVICGMVGGKDHAGFLQPLVPYIDTLHAVSIPNEPLSAPADLICSTAKQCAIRAETAESVEEALQSIAKTANQPICVLMCGSLYLAGHVLLMEEE